MPAAIISLLAGGCASQVKKTETPPALEKEIKSIEGTGYVKPQPQPQPKPKTPAAVTKKTHIIKKKETLWSISKKYGVSVQSILSANPGIKSKDLNVGQKIVIPTSGKVSASYSPPQSYSTKSNTAPGTSGRGFIWPVNGQVTSRFGEPRNGAKNMGIYIQPNAEQKLVASKKGIVEAVSHTNNGFYTIVIKHDGGIRTIAGCYCDPVVGEGSSVERGQPIANIKQGAGTQEVNFKIYIKDKPANPLSYLP